MITTCPAKEWQYPITLDEFKMFFLREAGLEYQPYPTWEKTTWDKGDVCFLDNVFYRSLVDLNHTIPTQEPEPDEEGIVKPIWEPLTVIAEPETSYPKGTIAWDGKYFWEALENTDFSAENARNWKMVIPCQKFPNARPWVVPVAYSEGSKVFAIVNFKPGVWVSQMNDNYSNPAVNPPIPDQDPEVLQWEYSEDDSEEMEDWVLDLDILRAMGEASFKFNPRLFTEGKGKMIFLYLTMFFLVYDRQMASGGMNGGSGGAGPITHRTVGKMSVSYAESKLFQNYPSYEFLATNDYGRKAFNLMMPYLRGGVRILCGGSTGD